MCGIVAACAQRDVVPILIEGLKALEYRGYDSAGVLVEAGDALRRAGFVHEGTLRQHIRWDGDYVDVELFGLLEDEWPGYAAKVETLSLEPSDLDPKPKPEKKPDEEKKPA